MDCTERENDWKNVSHPYTEQRALRCEWGFETVQGKPSYSGTSTLTGQSILGLQ